MREEKRSEIIHEALNFLEDEIIEETDKLRGGVLVDKKTLRIHPEEKGGDVKIIKQKELRPWRKWAAMAASVCLLFLVGGVWNATIGKEVENLSEDYLTVDKDVEEEKEQDNSVIDIPEAEVMKDSANDQESFKGSESISEESVSADQELFGTGLEGYVTAYYITKEKWSTELEEMESVKEQRAEFQEKNRECVERFLDEFQNGERQMADTVSTWEEFEREAEPIYHLFVERQDGTQVHLLLFGDGYACYYGGRSVWVSIEDEVYTSMIEIMEEK